MSTPRAQIAVAAAAAALFVGWGVLRTADGEVARPGGAPADSATVELGRRLFFDPAITRAGMRACADCHDPEHGYSDPAKQSADLRAVTPQHAQTLVDVADSKTFHWHGELASLEDVITPRLEDTTAPQYYGGRGVEGCPPIETTLPAFIASTLDPKKLPTAAVTMGVSGRYHEAFSAAFGTSSVTTKRVAQAIEAYVRSIRSGDSAYDRYAAGDERAMSPAAARGLDLFRGAAGCAGCHTIDARPSSSGAGASRPAPRAR